MHETAVQAVHHDYVRCSWCRRHRHRRCWLRVCAARSVNVRVCKPASQSPCESCGLCERSGQGGWQLRVCMHVPDRAYDRRPMHQGGVRHTAVATQAPHTEEQHITSENSRWDVSRLISLSSPSNRIRYQRCACPWNCLHMPCADTKSVCHLPCYQVCSVRLHSNREVLLASAQQACSAAEICTTTDTQHAAWNQPCRSSTVERLHSPCCSSCLYCVP